MSREFTDLYFPRWPGGGAPAFQFSGNSSVAAAAADVNLMLDPSFLSFPDYGSSPFPESRMFHRGKEDEKPATGETPDTPISSASTEAAAAGGEMLCKVEKGRSLKEEDASDADGEDTPKRQVKKGDNKKKRQPRVAFVTKSEVDQLDDGYRWRKYGQKAVKNSPYPRSYYRCTMQKCEVKKRVERSFQDPTVVITTYEGQHNHHLPANLRGNLGGIFGFPQSPHQNSIFPQDLMAPVPNLYGFCDPFHQQQLSRFPRPGYELPHDIGHAVPEEES